MFKRISKQIAIPDHPGIYFIRLSEKSNLSCFGTPFSLLYIGKAEDSLKDRLVNQHFITGKTGSSSLRKTLGAVLKEKLSLHAMPRSETEKSNRRFSNYSFIKQDDTKLTEWMNTNLEFCFIEHSKMNEKDKNSTLRKVEVRYTIKYLPTLDLDRATKKYNIFAKELSDLRVICKIEAKQYKS